MNKKRISKQQSKRIANQQAKYLTKNNSQDSENLATGLVISRFGSHAEIETEQGLRLHCSIRPNLKSIVAGDKIVYLKETPEQGVIISLHPRNSTLIRPTYNGKDKPMAANITQVIVTIAPEPKISWPLLDSYLVYLELLNLSAKILLNKTDLPCETIKKRLKKEYEILGYPVIFCSSYKDHGNNQLMQALNAEISVFIGQSGVGKSSIISNLLGDELIQTQELSSHSLLGQHTTSVSRYYHLPQGGALIDSPGVREFNLNSLDFATIVAGYREFKPFLQMCKFRNCNHIDTIGCEIKSAVTRHQISPHRYENFVKLCQQYLT